MIRTPPAIAAQSRRRAIAPGGFSLLELIAVIVILGVFAAVALPRYSSSLDHRSATAAAAQVAAELDAASRSAAAAGAPRLLRVDPDLMTVSLEAEDDAGDWTVLRALPLARPPLPLDQVSVSLTQSDTITNDAKRSGVAGIHYNGWGEPLTSARFALRAGSVTARVDLAAATGVITITD